MNVSKIYNKLIKEDGFILVDANKKKLFEDLKKLDFNINNLKAE